MINVMDVPVPNQQTDNASKCAHILCLGRSLGLCDNCDGVKYFSLEKYAGDFDGDNKYDSVSSPSHYIEGRKYEPRKVITDWGLNFNLGNAVKYLSRAGRKGDKIEDLRKAIQYIEFEIEESEGKKK